MKLSSKEAFLIHIRNRNAPLMWSVRGRVSLLQRGGTKQLHLSSFVATCYSLVQKDDPCFSLLAEESYRGACIRVFSTLFAKCFRSEHADSSTRVEGSLSCLMGDLQRAVLTAYCFPVQVPAKSYLALMQACPVFTKPVNCWCSHLMYSGTVTGTECHFWQPKQVTSFLLLQFAKTG